MQMLLITITSSQQSIDLQVPGELPISDLLPALLEICYSPTEAGANVVWQVVYGNKALPLDRTLCELAVPDGAILRFLQYQASPLARNLHTEQKRPRRFVPRNISPGRDTGGIGVQWSRE
jgi:WXG100 protein secretion system (Wss), protein YukD